MVAEAGALIPERSRRMLLGILDLERATVEDIMVPRNEIEGLEPPTFENILSYIDRQFEARGVTLSKLEIARPTLGQKGELVKAG